MPKKTIRDQAIRFGTLKDQLGYVLRRSQLDVFTDFFETMREVDLTPGQYSVLVLIDQNPGLPQSKIGEALGIRKSNFVTLLHLFERRGLVQRRAHGGDARINELYLTDKGKTLLRRANTLQSAHEARLAERLGSSGREKLLLLLKSLSGET
jgi:DNA-binding MarR family transcriptional regulator